MTFRIPEKIEKYDEELYEKKYIVVKGEKVHVSKLEDKSVTIEQIGEMQINGYARDDIPPKLTDEALIDTAKYYLSQCSEPPFCSTYNEALIHKIVPELIKRLKDEEK